MKVIFMGTPDFSVGTLEALAEAGHEVVLAVTQPDKPKGRGGKMQYTPVKEAALARDIPVYQPKKIREPECIEDRTPSIFSSNTITGLLSILEASSSKGNSTDDTLWLH